MTIISPQAAKRTISFKCPEIIDYQMAVRRFAEIWLSRAKNRIIIRILFVYELNRMKTEMKKRDIIARFWPFKKCGGRMNRRLSLFPMPAIIISAAMIGIAFSSAAGQDAPAPLDVQEVIRKVDELYRANSSYAKLEMEIVTPHWQRTLQMDTWTEGTTKTFIRILSPPKEKNLATLRLKNEMWNYLPRANKVIKIPPSMMMSSWMGSDFTNDDLVKEFTLVEDYSHRFVQPPDAKPDLMYIESIPREDLPVVWGRIVAAVRKDNYLPVWGRYYDEQDKLMRVMDYKEVKRLGGRLLPSVMELIPQDKDGQKTVLRYLSAEFNIRLPKEIFSLRNLRSRN